MKEPKFRGYHKETKQWHYGFGFFINQYTEAFKQEKGTEDDATLLTEGHPVTVELRSVGQYATTIQDIHQNKQELFDGDIIRFRYEGDWNEWTKPMLVHWGGDEYPAFDLKGHSYDCNLLSLLVASGEYQVEVLGNIYQNPELLT